MMNMTEIKNRITSIEQTRKITKAMHLISTVKMRKALERYEQNATYIERLRSGIKDIILHSTDIHNPFLDSRPGNRTAFIVIAGDKGLAGPYNANILKMALNHMQDTEERFIFTVGHMATNFFNRKKYMVDVEFLHTAQNPKLLNARQIAEVIIDLYEQNLIDRVEIIYTKMITTLSQEPTALTLLPLDQSFFADVEVNSNFKGAFQYDPSPKKVFDIMIPQYIIGVIYAALVQAFACEQCARMSAMDSATQNADEIISKMKRLYSRARQAAVTNEMLEVVNGTNAVQGK